MSASHFITHVQLTSRHCQRSCEASIRQKAMNREENTGFLVDRCAISS